MANQPTITNECLALARLRRLQQGNEKKMLTKPAWTRRRSSWAQGQGKVSYHKAKAYILVHQVQHCQAHLEWYGFHRSQLNEGRLVLQEQHDQQQRPCHPRRPHFGIHLHILSYSRLLCQLGLQVISHIIKSANHAHCKLLCTRRPIMPVCSCCVDDLLYPRERYNTAMLWCSAVLTNCCAQSAIDWLCKGFCC